MVLVTSDTSLTKEQLLQKLVEMDIEPKLEENTMNKRSYVQIAKIVHIIASDDDMDYLVDQCGAYIVSPMKCFFPKLGYSVLSKFPEKRYSLAWTDSMDFYVVGIASFS